MDYIQWCGDADCTFFLPPGAFNKLAPTNGATDRPTNQYILWSASSGATSYEYCIGDNAGTCTTWINRGAALYAYPSGLIAGHTYYWQVRSKLAGVYTYADGADVTAGWTFATAGAAPGAFNKLAPTNGATGRPTNQYILWSASSGATSYEYCIGDNAGTCTTWINTGSALYAYPSGLIAGHTYYWQVRSKLAGVYTYADGADVTYGWTFATLGVAPGAFNKLFPTNGATNRPTNQYILWSASSGATSYEYCIGDNAGTCTTWINRGAALYAYPSGLIAGHTYYWQVRSKLAGVYTYADGADVTAGWTFATAGAAPGAFNKLAPTNGATGRPTNQYILWSASSGATSYEYCIGDNAGTCTTWINRGAATYAYPSGLAAGQHYYWQVRAVLGGFYTYADGVDVTAGWTFDTAP